MTNLDKVRDIYRGIANRDAAMAVRHFDERRYLDHDPNLSNGIESIRAYIDAMPPDARLTIVRIFADGDYVVTQSDGQADGQERGNGTFFDVYRFDDGAIVEHWAFAAPPAPPNASGHTQLDGPIEAGRAEDTEANRAFVRDYYETFHIQGHHDQADRYFAGSPMIRHEPGVTDGVDAFLSDLALATRDRTIDEIKLLLGRGDLFFLAALGTHAGDPCAYVDLYRVDSDTIAEHWGFFQPIPPPHARDNANAMF